MAKSLKKINWKLYFIHLLKIVILATIVCIKGNFGFYGYLSTIGLAILADTASFLSDAEKQLKA